MLNWRHLSLAMLLPLPLLLASCATMSKEECVAADWRVVGETDGAAGYAPQERFAAHAKSCSKAGVVPDQSRWYEGYRQGLKRYCTPLNGLDAGQAGKTYHNVCPAETAPGFLRGYHVGRAEYEQRRRVERLESRIDTAEMRMRDLRLRIAAGTVDERDGRRLLRDYWRDLQDARFELQREEFRLRDLERDARIFAANPDMVAPSR